MMSKFDQTLTTFFQTGLDPDRIKPGPFVVAVSGGQDSLCLLHWLAHAPLIEKKIIAVYVDHGLRPEAKAEGEALRQLSAEWGAACHVRHAGLTADTFTENSGRVARYKILRDVAEQEGASYILTGHHAADQAETVLLHLLRGSGLTGLTGMREQASVPVDDGAQTVKLLRPMLAATPEMIQAYVTLHDLEPFEDPSNQDARFVRNRIRHSLIPHLQKEYNPQITKGLSQMAQILQDDWDALEQIHLQNWENGRFEKGDGWCALDHPHWNAANPSYQRFALRKLYACLNGSTQDLAMENLESARQGLIMAKTGKRYQLSGMVWVQAVYGKLVATLPTAEDLFGSPQIGGKATVIAPDTVSTMSLHDGIWTLNLTPIAAEDVDLKAAAENRWVAFVDADKVEGQLVMRGRVIGETFRPFGLVGEVALKKLMIDRKIPAMLRKQWPILADDSGPLWVAGHRLAQRATISDQTQNALKIELTKPTI